MIRLLPFILIPVIILGGLWYWRSSSAKPELVTSETTQVESSPVEVPKTLPSTSLEDRVKTLEKTVGKLSPQGNVSKSSPSSADSSSVSDSRINDLEAAVTELKMRVSSLENTSPAPAAAAAKAATVYIPLGAGGGPWADVGWNSLAEYEISLDPANYPGYTGMNLEVNFRLTEAAGTGSVRLYNVTDGSAVSGQLDTTSTAFTLQSTFSFKLPAGAKTYRLQLKSSSGMNMFVQSARIKVSF